jgi:hypothetical protein
LSQPFENWEGEETGVSPPFRDVNSLSPFNPPSAIESRPLTDKTLRKVADDDYEECGFLLKR